MTKGRVRKIRTRPFDCLRIERRCRASPAPMYLCLPVHAERDLTDAATRVERAIRVRVGTRDLKRAAAGRVERRREVDVVERVQHVVLNRERRLPGERE